MVKKTKHKQKGGKADKEFYIQLGFVAVLLLVVGISLTHIYASKGIPTGFGTVSAESVVPTGIPAIYGKELGISYDDVTPSNSQTTEATINKLASYENMQLDSAEMSRYKQIASSISCEYCCDAQALIFSDGSRACGCSHSYAMRGLAKYLLKNHPEMTNQEILSELGKWKTLFFPTILQGKAKVLQEKGIAINYVNLASNEYRGIENGQGSGQMVGDC